MAYIGKTPINRNFVKLDAISVVNGQAGYTMNNGGSAFTDYENVQISLFHLMVFYKHQLIIYYFRFNNNFCIKFKQVM